MSDNNESQRSRLERIEVKLDLLAEAMVSLARAEEKILNIQKDNSMMYKRLNKMDEKLDNLGQTAESNSRTISIINKIFWAVCTAVIAAVAANIWM